jgi:hypothetical protein
LQGIFQLCQFVSGILERQFPALLSISNGVLQVGALQGERKEEQGGTLQ